MFGEAPMKRLLTYRDLRSRGIPFSRKHIHDLVKQRKFPAPGKVGLKTNAWTDDQIDEYIEDCVPSSEAADNRAA
jgi:prophage regulatory protein